MSAHQERLTSIYINCYEQLLYATGLKQRADQEDALHNVCVALLEYRYAYTLDPAGEWTEGDWYLVLPPVVNALAWLRRLLYLEGQNLRGRLRSPVSVLPPAVERPYVTPARLDCRVDLQRAIRESCQHPDWVWRHWVMGETFEELARGTQWSSMAVTHRLLRVRAKLAENLSAWRQDRRFWFHHRR